MIKECSPTLDNFISKAFRICPVPMCITTLDDGLILYANGSFIRKSGFTRKELIGRSTIELGITKEETRKNIVKAIKKNGKLKDFYLKARSKNGEHWDFLCTGDIITVGSHQCLFSTFVDVTDRKLAEKKADQYIKRLKILLDLNRAILEFSSPPQIARDALERIQKLVPCQRLNLTLLDFENEEIEYIAVKSLRNYSMKIPKRIPMKPFQGYIEAMKTGEVIVTKNSVTRISEFDSASAYYEKGFRSSIAVPLIFHDNLIGVINMLSNTEEFFIDEYIDIARDIADPLAIAIQQARLYQSLDESRKRLKALSRQLVEAHENERRHISHDILHDEVGQRLSVLKFNLFKLRKSLDNSKEKRLLDESMNILNIVFREVHDLSVDLRPPIIDDLGLVPALEWLLGRYSTQTGTQVRFNADNFEKHMPRELESTCFRIAQEAITNIIRHSKANKVKIELRQLRDELLLRIIDDGIGFDLKKVLKQSILGKSLGLLGMQERVKLIGGELKIETSHKCGTHIEARFPLSDDL